MEINNTPVYVGTSGYNYEDWKGTFAPKDTDNYDLLTHYKASNLNFLELTYTFYRMPIAEKIAGICDRLGDIKLSIRLNKSLMRKKPDKLEIESFKEGIAPAIERGTAVALLADFHHLFSAGRENFDILLELKENFKDLPLFVELTNSTWHKEKYYDEFKANQIGICVIDGPAFRGFAPYRPVCSNNGVYFRLYGKDPLWLSGTDKFLNYSYSDNELKRFMQDARDVSVMAKNIFFSFCNVENGYAPKNAVTLKNMIEQGL